MSLRTRIALLVGVTVLVASAIGGVGTAVSSRNVGRNRIDTQLRADAAGFPGDAPRIGAELQLAFEARAVACDADRTARAPRAQDRDERRLRLRLEFASAMQLVRPTGRAVAACQTLPIGESDLGIATSGVGTTIRTVSIEGERFRLLTQGYGDLGAVQFARSLELTDATLRGLLVRAIGFGLIGAVLAGALGWLIAARVTGPVTRLSATAQRVAQTRDLGQRIEVEGDDEIGALAASFNTMLSSLDTSREQQQRLVQDASHELRTPLTSMRTNVELLQRHANIDAATRSQVLADIGAELAELSELTSELVESASEVPTQVRVDAVFDLTELVGDCAERARRRHRRAIELRSRDDEPSIVAGDSALLGRAVTNLINNAVKFSDAAIEIEVARCSVVVLDRGPGIADEDLPRIFDRFYRATTARSATGSGLGLAIVKQIVEGHGGVVHAENRHGGGAAIGFSIPPARTAYVN